MALFQKSVINKYLRHLDKTKVSEAYDAYRKIFTVEKTDIIKGLKEEEYQDGFLRDLFVNILGYKLNLDSPTLKQQDEWEEYFNSYKKEINDLQAEIKKTDAEIDQMVYKLYELTEEEIRIVEESV